MEELTQNQGNADAQGVDEESSAAFVPTPKPKKKVHKGEGLWLMSFSDMSLSLLCFFILMMSTMSPNKDKFEKATEELTREGDKGTKNMRVVSEEVKQAIDKNKLSEVAEVHYDATGLNIEFKNKILFDSGSDVLSENLEKSLSGILGTISQISGRYHMTIEGHTDDEPLSKGSEFYSNWELSAARGFAIMRMFAKRGVAEDHMSVQAFAHTRPKVPYDGLKGKKRATARAQNRRVLIRID